MNIHSNQEEDAHGWMRETYTHTEREEERERERKKR